MKKISYLCLVIVILFSGLLITNIFETKDTIRLNEIEMNDSAFRFYLTDSQKSIKEQLVFFENLSQSEHISVFRTDVHGDTIIKSVVFEQSSFPFEKFYLPNDNLFKDKSVVYANYEVTDNEEAKIPTFSKSKILLQSMEKYYKDSSISLNGIYSVVGTNASNSDKIIDQLSDFFCVSKDELLSEPVQQKFGFINRSLLIYIAIILSTFLILAIVNIYTPLLQLKKIGVKKLNGISNIIIFSDFIKLPLLAIFAVSFLFDIFLYFYYSYHPKYLFLTLILSQLFIILVFLITNIFTYLIVKNVTISKMLKNFLNFRFGVLICYFVKIGVSLLVSAILLLLSTDINTLIAQYKLNDTWQKNGNVLTLETYNLVDNDFQNFLLNNGKFEDKMVDLYYELENQINAKYIESSEVQPTRSLTIQDNNRYTADEVYEVMKVNYNYIKSLSIYNEEFIKEDELRTFLVPDSYEESENIVYLCKNILFDSLNSEQQENLSIEDLSINVCFYDDHNFEVFSYAEADNPVFTKPIFMLLNSNDIPWLEKIMLRNTGVNNPLKIDNTKDNQKFLNRIIEKETYKSLNLKFSSINSILGDITYSYKQSIQIFSFILFSLFLLSIFTSIFLVNCIILSNRKKVAIYKLFGFSIIDRYDTLFMVFGGIYFIQLLSVLFLTESLLLTPYILITLLIDIAVVVQVIINKEKNNLSAALKGE